MNFNGDMVKKANRKFMQKWNRQLVLAIARESGLISQVDIMRKSGLSAGTVVNITRQLRKEKFLQPVGQGKSIGGRRPNILKFNTSAKYIISALCLYKETQIAIVDLAGVIIARTSFPTLPEKGVENFLKNFKEHLDRLFKSSSVTLAKMMALCVSFEGMVDARAGVLIHCVRLGWKDVPFKDHFQTQLGIDTYIENNGRTAVLGEHVFGVGKPFQNIVYLALESGIGASIIHEGRIFHGSHQMEGEIGHTVRDPAGPLCRCGKRGCLEALAAGPAVIAAARAVGLAGMAEINGTKSEEETYHHVLCLAGQGDKKARQILEKAAQLLGHAIADIINLVDTELVVLAGYMVEKDADFLLNMIRDVAQARFLDNPRRRVNIVKGSLGNDAVLIGGAMLACQKTFSMPEWK